MEKQFITISIYTENFVGLLNRVSTIFSKRHINIESITASKSEIEGVHRYTILVHETTDLITKVVGQLEKQIDVIAAFYHTEAEMIVQEIALYKMEVSNLYDANFKKLINNNNARIIDVEKEFVVIEKAGKKQGIEQLYDALKPYGMMQFVRSGRIAVSKEKMQVSKRLETNNINL